MLLRPLRDRVVLRRVDADEMTVGGAIVPGPALEQSQHAEVVGAGSGEVYQDGSRGPRAVRPGDRILFGRYSGADVKLGGREYLIRREDEILAVRG